MILICHGVGESLDDGQQKIVKNENDSKVFVINGDGKKTIVKPIVIPVCTTKEKNRPKINFLKFNNTSVVDKTIFNILLAAPNKQSKINYELQLDGWSFFVDNELNFKYNSLFYCVKVPVCYTRSTPSPDDDIFDVLAIPVFKQIPYHYKNLVDFNDLIFSWNNAVAKYQGLIEPFLTLVKIGDLDDGTDKQAIINRAKRDGFMNAGGIVQMAHYRKTLGIDNMFTQIFQLANLNKTYTVYPELNGDFSFDLTNYTEKQIYLDKPIEFNRPDKLEKATRN